jgi:hypothetical protein
MDNTPQSPDKKEALEPFGGQRWTLEFAAAGVGPPLEIRIRKLLKMAGRTYGLRCIGYGPSRRPAESGEKP